MMDVLLPLTKVARLLAVPKTSIRQWRREGVFPLPVILPDGRCRWRASEISVWIATLRQDDFRNVGQAKMATVASSGQGANGQEPAVASSGQNADGQGPAVAEQPLPKLAREMLQALKTGKCLNNLELERAIGGNADQTTGSWRRAIRILKARRLIYLDTLGGGYRMVSPSGH